MIARLLLGLCIATFAATAFAHKPSDSYLTLRVADASVDGQWDIALRDLDAVLDLDRNADGRIDWGELRSRSEEIDAYASSHLALASAGERCPLAIADHLVDRHSDGGYVVLALRARCPAAIDTLAVDYGLLFDVDAQHRGLLKLETPSARVVSAVFPATKRTQAFALEHASAWTQLHGYIADGITHIAAGFDHLLFLVALLLPSVLVRSGRRWVPVTSFPRALRNVAATVTAFTAAHSITLSLATLSIVALPSRLVESLIALSVLLTALDNVWPILPRARWQVAFAFGLLHGFGFASVLADLDLPPSSLALSLFGFNVGVEIGQLVLVLLLVPLVYLVRESRLYPRVGLATASGVIALLSSGWLIERSFDVRFLPF
ncbi:MAG TPA: HupE/UreJ family protein [Rhodanobacteraceae bacterium]|nr:HupE/UreJ family protein [Rhodanobacteraceae bacterium]